jgi:lipopolysaccharide export system protein LptA
MNCKRSPKKVSRSDRVKNFFVLFLITGFLSLSLCTGSLAQQRPAPTPRSSPGTSGKAHSTSAPAAKSTASPEAASKPNEKKTNDFFGGEDSGQPKGPTEITAKDEAQFDMHTRTGVFIGNVKVVDPQFTMTADRLTVHLNKQEDGGGLEQAEAEGNVFIVHLNAPKAQDGSAGQPNSGPQASKPPGAAGQTAQQPVRSTGKAAKAIYQAKDGSVTLLGWPEVTQGDDTQIATDPDVKMILYRDGRMRTFGSTRTVIQEKIEPTPSPAAPGAAGSRASIQNRTQSNRP